MLRELRRVLFRLSRTRPMGLLVRLAFGRLWWLLPVRRVAQTRGVLAFDHPAPSWQPHLLLVPKRSIRSVLAARPADAPLVGELLRLALVLAHRRGLHRQGFALLVNGGAYQDVPQLHFHLAGLDDGLRYTLPPQAPTRPPLLRTSNLAAYRHPRPQRAVAARRSAGSCCCWRRDSSRGSSWARPASPCWRASCPLARATGSIARSASTSWPAARPQADRSRTMRRGERSNSARQRAAP
jgi:diadenosine tetraphosphate (Ap4A) HIT family hydrolase